MLLEKLLYWRFFQKMLNRFQWTSPQMEAQSLTFLFRDIFSQRFKVLIEKKTFLLKNYKIRERV